MAPFDQEDVPGTILLFDRGGTDEQRHAHQGDIILHPQPSLDPEDPLNWRRSRKKLAVSMVYLYTFAIGICTAAQYSILTPISKSQKVSIGQLNSGTGFMQLMQGWGCLLWQPIALTYGRRFVYIVTIVLSTGPVLWTPFSHGAGQWYAHRILLGLFCSPVESLPEVSVPDLFFAHERGRYMALYAFILFGSNFLAPFFAGFIADGMDWRWVMYFSTILMVICSTIMFLFTEDTIYFRETMEGVEPTTSKFATTQADTEQRQETDESRQEIQSSKSRLRKLSLITRVPGRPTKMQMLLKSWMSLKIIVLFPNILWAGLLY
ncbi:Major facilitator superfamily domain general substrate transporter, partial [Fusarium albosuccineum]